VQFTEISSLGASRSRKESGLLSTAVSLPWIRASGIPERQPRRSRDRALSIDSGLKDSSSPPNDLASGPVRVRSADRQGMHPTASIHSEGDDRRFTTEGLAGAWTPYGGGSRQCPGRNFAKQEIILGFALMLSMFEIGLTSTRKSGAVEPDMEYHGAGNPSAKREDTIQHQKADLPLIRDIWQKRSRILSHAQQAGTSIQGLEWRFVFEGQGCAVILKTLWVRLGWKEDFPCMRSYPASIPFCIGPPMTRVVEELARPLVYRINRRPVAAQSSLFIPYISPWIVGSKIGR